jgi:glycine cleavage system H protein
MKVPDNLMYTNDHEWLRVDGDFAFVGITDFAQSELGDVVFVEVETVGEIIPKENVFGTVEAVKTVSDLFMPVGGKILEFNKEIETNPEIVNKDPYGKGWLVKISIIDKSEVNELLTAGDYKKLIGG